jgi:rubrerythrin
MTKVLEEAIRFALFTEKSCFDFYQRAARLMIDSRSKELFERLAGEEGEHGREFLRLCLDKGVSLHSVTGELKHYSDPVHPKLEPALTAHMTEKDALRLALQEEQMCIDRYEVFVRALRDPEACGVFEKAISDSRRHYEIVEAEYMRITGNPGHLDQDAAGDERLHGRM